MLYRLRFDILLEINIQNIVAGPLFPKWWHRKWMRMSRISAKKHFLAQPSIYPGLGLAHFFQLKKDHPSSWTLLQSRGKNIKKLCTCTSQLFDQTITSSANTFAQPPPLNYFLKKNPFSFSANTDCLHGFLPDRHSKTTVISIF